MSSLSSPLISASLPVSSPTAAPVNKDEMRDCTRCKRGQIPAHLPWKSCVKCREKRREYNKSAASRVVLAGLEIPNGSGPLTNTNGKRKERKDSEEDMSDRLDKMKKKMKKYFKDKYPGSENGSTHITVSTQMILKTC